MDFGPAWKLWSRERGLSGTSIAYPPSFYLHLKDPHTHWEMIEGQSSRYRVEECSFNFNTIFGTFQGHIFASRKVAGKIEVQTCCAAELFNVDVRQDRRHMAEKYLFPFGNRDESRFSPDFEVPLSSLEIQVQGDPNLPSEISCVQVFDGHKKGAEKVILSDLLEFIKVHDPDVILSPYTDTWVPLIVRKARHYSMELVFSRTGRFKPMVSKSYWSYGRLTTRMEP
jgi:DNA polymerase, archaea type